MLLPERGSGKEGGETTPPFRPGLAAFEARPSSAARQMGNGAVVELKAPDDGIVGIGYSKSKNYVAPKPYRNCKVSE